MATVKNYGKRLRRPRKKDLLRLIEQLRKDYEDLNDIVDEKDREISELRELLAEIEVDLNGIAAYAEAERSETIMMKQMIRSYRQDFGLLPPEEPADDDWDGK